jgi:hypothetical protein
LLATLGRPAMMKLTKPSEMTATSNWLVAMPSHGGGTARAARRSNHTAKASATAIVAMPSQFSI